MKHSARTLATLLTGVLYGWSVHAADLPAAASDRAGASAVPVADTVTAKLPEIVVTATRFERDIDFTSKSVSIISRADIEARNATNVLELLESVPGISLSRAGGIEGQVTLRGFNSNDGRTLLLIDGDRFRGRLGLEYTLLDPNQIERIEIIRGPASTLYGPDALAGVINIITRRATGDISQPFALMPRLHALDLHSANDLTGGRVELQGLGNGVDMLLGLNARVADDYATPAGDIPNSDFATRSADLRLGYTPVAGHRLELTAKFAEVEAGRAGGISGAPGAPFVKRREAPLRERFIKLGYSGKLPGPDLESIEASVYARDLFTAIEIENRTRPGRLSEVDNIIGGPLVIGGKLLGTLAREDHLLTAGMDFFHQMGTGTQTGTRTTDFNSAGAISAVNVSPRRQTAPDNAQTDIGIFIHDDWDPAEHWTLSLGARLDRIRTTTQTDPLPDEALREAFESGRETVETPVTGGLGVIYRPWPTLHFTGNINRAFRAPATTESFGASRQGTGFLVPNPGLKSEQGLTLELGTRLRLSSLTGNLVAFYSDYQNLIVSKPLIFQGLPSSRRENTGEATIQGVEMDLNWSISRRWEAFINAAWLRGTDTADDAGSDKGLAYIPPPNGLAGLRYTGTHGFFVEASSKWSLRKDRIDPEQERDVAGFAVFDLHAGIDLDKLSANLHGLSLSIGLENLFDKTYRQASTVEDVRFRRSASNPLLEPGHSVSLTLRSRF